MFAQTNLQLFRQLDAGPYTDDVSDAVREAYGLAVSGFSGQYRASGKTFIAHLVGTTSVLATQGERKDMLLAGLLHAVYSNADLGFHQGRRQSARKRQFVRERIGAGAEELIAHYDASTWSTASINEYLERYGALKAAEKDSLKISLANTVDDFIDGGMCLPLSKKSRLYTDVAAQRSIVALAALTGWNATADLLERLFAEFNAARPHLPESSGQGTATLRLPPSVRRKLLPRIRGYCNRRLRPLTSAGLRQ